MSYREIRNFTEMMRGLGYPRLISMENFRKPNFELVADILYWMVKIYDPDTTLSDRVEFENERVEFLTSIATLLAAKARLKLNTKKLYASDGRAVQELLKLASLLYKATKTANKKYEEETVPPPIKAQDVKSARVLASEITQTGAKLYDLLETENTDRLDRSRALRFLDQAASAADGPKEQAFIERSIRDIIENTKQALEDLRKECEELDADERNIKSKIQKKQEELERTEKRLKSIENVRPQFMEETEKLEKELQRYYEIYMEKHRNLDYLEFELDKFKRTEEERMQEQELRMRKMRERLLKEEVELMRGGLGAGGGGNTDDGEGGGIFGRKERNVPQEKPPQSARRGPRVEGSMINRDQSSDESGDDDEDDEDDEILSVNENRHRQGGYGMGNGRGKEDVFLDDDEDEDDEDGEDDEDDDEGDDGDLSGGSDDF